MKFLTKEVSTSLWAVLLIWIIGVVIGLLRADNTVDSMYTTGVAVACGLTVNFLLTLIFGQDNKKVTW